MLGNADTYVSNGQWWLVYPVGVCLVAVVMACNLIGDGLRDAFDVRLRRRLSGMARRARRAARALEVTNLTTHIKLSRSTVQAVGNVDLAIDAGETLGLVGESGCGKSMLGLSILGLLPEGRRDHRGLGPARRTRARRPAGQASCAAPRQRGGDDLPGLAVLAEPDQDDRRAGGRAGAAAPRRVAQARPTTARSRCWSWSGCRSPRSGCSSYPHQLSGGLRQRVMIAIALACEPKVLLADEPTTALDVTIQAQILALLDDLEERLGMATLLVTHDMGVVAGRTDRISVMYAGRIVEIGRDRGDLHAPCAIPTRRRCSARSRGSTRTTARRSSASAVCPPTSRTRPPAAASRPAVRRATEQCREEEPPLTGPDADHLFACWHPVDGPVEQPNG